MDRRPSARSTKVKPKLTVKCSGCGAALGNPLTHRCTTKTDFRQRKKQAAKPAPKPASTGNAHDYASCDDDDCSRFQCRVYKEGVANGTEVGRQLGYAEGYADGFGAGFSTGLASCPGPHSG